MSLSLFPAVTTNKLPCKIMCAVFMFSSKFQSCFLCSSSFYRKIYSALLRLKSIHNSILTHIVSPQWITVCVVLGWFPFLCPTKMSFLRGKIGRNFYPFFIIKNRKKTDNFSVMVEIVLHYDFTTEPTVDNAFFHLLVVCSICKAYRCVPKRVSQV